MLTSLPRADTADASDHVPAATAIAKGIAKGHSKEKPGFWLHTSGTGILCWKDEETKTFGEPPSQPAYDDLDAVGDLTSLPDKAFHRDVDKLVLAASSDVVKTAIVCPSTIYGIGRGPGNTRSKQVPGLARATLERGKAPQVGRGLTEWDNVHIDDVSQFFVLLVEAAIAHKPELDSELWGPNGYFLLEATHHVWGQVAKQIAEEAYKQGFLQSPEVEPLSADEALKIAGFQALSWGLNSKGYAKRARKFLGWAPKGAPLEAEIPATVAAEAASLGLKSSKA
jgi:hypothetical protein